ncbi:hypothetical protein A7P96_07870 [Eikenella sp. NML03-A-027]|nr:hypothetical protein A7P96_07870 [Eikenella sp. NML03-A-027]
MSEIAKQDVANVFRQPQLTGYLKPIWARKITGWLKFIRANEMLINHRLVHQASINSQVSSKAHPRLPKN